MLLELSVGQRGAKEGLETSLSRVWHQPYTSRSILEMNRAIDPPCWGIAMVAAVFLPVLYQSEELSQWFSFLLVFHLHWVAESRHLLTFESCALIWIIAAVVFIWRMWQYNKEPFGRSYSSPVTAYIQLLTVFRYSGLCLLVTIGLVFGIATFPENTTPLPLWIPLSADLAVLVVALAKDFLAQILHASGQFGAQVARALNDCLGFGAEGPQQ